ncbi:MAG: hypothetical protein HY425_02770 [Candidatus Levybacteria bacterium]|nr:hypothetical protein [Candidatus Levybacteria bacterium]
MLDNMLEAKAGAENQVRKLTSSEARGNALRLIESFKISLLNTEGFATRGVKEKLLGNNVYAPINFQRGQNDFSLEHCIINPDDGKLYFSLIATSGVGDNRMRETVILSVAKQSEIGGSVGYWRKFPNSVAVVDYDTETAVRGAESVLASLKGEHFIGAFT